MEFIQLESIRIPGKYISRCIRSILSFKIFRCIQIKSLWKIPILDMNFLIRSAKKIIFCAKAQGESPIFTQTIIHKANCLILRNVLTSLQTGMIRQTLPAVLKAIANHNGVNKIDDLASSNGKRFCVYDKKENILRFFNGAYIQFGAIRGSSDVSSTYDKILSTEWGHIFVDECSEVDELAIDTLKTRLAQKLDVTNKMIYALNPTTKSHWTYVRFFKRENREGLKLDPAVTERFFVVHFSIMDNREHLPADYVNTLSQLSALQRKRFLSGEYSDESEGEIFDHIPWGPVPSQLFDCLIYTDPSAKDNESCDYKASVLLASAADKIYLLGVKAVKGTSLQMMYNIFELFKMSPVPPRIIMEKKQVPLDFDTTFARFQSETGWNCPLTWDTRNNGNKFMNIESTLEPLFRNGRFIVNEELKGSPEGELLVEQFIFFSRK